MEVDVPKDESCVEQSVDKRNNVMLPSSHSLNLSNRLPSFSVFRSKGFNFTKYNNESGPMIIEQSKSTKNVDSSYLNETSYQFNGQETLSNEGFVKEKSAGVITHNPFYVINNNATADTKILNNICIQEVKYVDDEIKFKNHQDNNKSTRDVIYGSKKTVTTVNADEMIENMFHIDQPVNKSITAVEHQSINNNQSSTIMKAESFKKPLKSKVSTPKKKNKKCNKTVPHNNDSTKDLFAQFKFLEVENKLEKPFDIEVSPATITDQQVMKTQPKPLKSTKKPNAKNKKQTKKNEKIPPTPKKTKCAENNKKNEFKGPYITNKGTVENPDFVVVNKNILDDEDSLKSFNSIRKTNSSSLKLFNGEEKPKGKIVECNEWLCVYCSRGPNTRDIGCDPTGSLFGPYFVSILNTDKTNNNPKLNDSEIFIEIWTHENCLVWASGVFMVGPKIFGLEDSVRIARNTVCVYCGITGANIGCIARHCQSTTHYSCAVHLGWLLDSQTFMTTCNVHKEKKSFGTSTLAVDSIPKEILLKEKSCFMGGSMYESHNDNNDIKSVVMSAKVQINGELQTFWSHIENMLKNQDTLSFDETEKLGSMSTTQEIDKNVPSQKELKTLKLNTFTRTK